MIRRPLDIRNLFRDERGATVVEYALLAAIIGFGLTITLFAFQDDLYNIYVDGIANALGNFAGS